MNAKRIKFQTRLHSAIEQVIDTRSTIRKDLGTSYACLPGCGIAEVCFASFIQSLKESNLYPWEAIAARSIKETADNCKSVRHSVPEGAYACANKDCIGRSPHLATGTLPYLAQEVGKYSKELVGPCLTCYLDESVVVLDVCVHFPQKEPTAAAKVYTGADIVSTLPPRPQALFGPLQTASNMSAQEGTVPKERLEKFREQAKAQDERRRVEIARLLKVEQGLLARLQGGLNVPAASTAVPQAVSSSASGAIKSQSK